MRNDIVFKVSNTDFSDHVVAGTYAVNNEPVFTSYEDANGVEHRQKIRDRVVGTFDMIFKTLEDFNDFIECVKEYTLPSSCAVPILVQVNNTAELKLVNAFIDFSPTRNRNDMWQDYMERFQVKIKEM